MSGLGEGSKKRSSFSMLTRKDLAPSTKQETEEAELANGRFIPESKRGWKYELRSSQAVTASTSKLHHVAQSSASGSTIAAAGTPRRPKTADVSELQKDKSNGPVTAASGRFVGARSTPVSPKKRTVPLAGAPFDETSSDSSSGDERNRSSSSEDDLQASHQEALQQMETLRDGVEQQRHRHPDDLVYPESYPWKPSRQDPQMRFINPAHRNPTAKQAFYDTHFGSSSNYRGLLPASGSILSLSSSKTDARRQSDNKGAGTGAASAEQGADAQSSGLVSTVMKPFTTASKLITKARRKSVGNNLELPASAAAASTDAAVQQGEEKPTRPHAVPLFRAGGDELAAQRSGFSYGLSMEDAVQVEAVVSRHSSREDLSSPDRLAEELLEPRTHAVSSSKWKEAMHSVWGFLPSFDFLASPPPADASSKGTPSVNLLEAEAIPSVKKDSGAPDYFKNLSGNVVLMGGYRGSVLRDAETNMMMWIPIKVGVGLRRPTLELGLSREAEEHSEELVYSSEMCSHIGRLVDMGKRLEERIASRRHAKVYSWGYDWRLSLGLSSRKLVAFLEQLYEASAAEPSRRRGAKVVAHSMGGLVALHALATCKDPRIFEGLVFASTPFCGTPNILGPFRFGDAALFNDTICSPRATFSFRSSFYLLPTDKRCFEVPVGEPDQDEDALTEEQKRQRFKDVDFLDPHVWDELGLSPCLELGRRQEILALARKGADNGTEAHPVQSKPEKDSVDPDKLERETSGANKANAEDEEALKGIGSPDSSERAGPNGLTMGLMEGFSDGAALTGQAGVAASPDQQAALQPENRQGALRNDATASDSSALAFDSLDYPAQSWAYLERTLGEVRQFWADIELGFDPAKHAAGQYPPLMLMTSGRTPCVRGALVGVDSASRAEDTEMQGWKDDVRAGDYSRMTYAAGDGVITRRSATTLPGRWSTLLTKRSEAETLPHDRIGKGPPFTSKPPGKARLKMDRYRMRFDGEGIVESAHRHVTLLSDVDAVGKCLEAIRRANIVRNRLPLSSPNPAS
ncbi:uncharacterized protein PSANT_02403 [Moesziomyces antarcticus]|nr:uncharacterized protein PSANT_02403 [Moesziomyces antarcticus]